MAWQADSDGEAEDDEGALAAMRAWEPDPLDADPRRSSHARRLHDSIALLVGIYGSKELFIQEYRCFPIANITAHKAVAQAQVSTCCVRLNAGICWQTS